jgi:uncharacterized membrane protein YeaQ/YmgE (transglycosylase-associated protein family)
MLTGLIAWIVLGLIVGFIGSKLASKGGEAVLMDLFLGIVGALAGGWLFNAIGADGTTGLHGLNLLAAVGGAVVFLVGWHALRLPAWHA